MRPCARDEDKARCPYRLAICRRRSRGVRRLNDVSCHKVLQCALRFLVLYPIGPKLRQNEGTVGTHKVPKMQACRLRNGLSVALAIIVAVSWQLRLAP